MIGSNPVAIRIMTMNILNLVRVKHNGDADDLMMGPTEFQNLSTLSRIVNMLVRSCFLITLLKCLKGHKSLGSLVVCQVVKS